MALMHIAQNSEENVDTVEPKTIAEGSVASVDDAVGPVADQAAALASGDAQAEALPADGGDDADQVVNENDDNADQVVNENGDDADQAADESGNEGEAQLRPDSGGIGEYLFYSGGKVLAPLQRLSYLEGLGSWRSGQQNSEIIHLEEYRRLREDLPQLPVARDITIAVPFKGETLEGGVLVNATVNEGDLPYGSLAGSPPRCGWRPFDLPPGIRVEGLSEGGLREFPSPHGVLVIRLEGGKYAFNFELTRPVFSSGGNNGRNVEIDGEVIAIPITDGLSTGTASVAITVIDDVPECFLNSTESEVPNGGSMSGVFGFVFGADGPHPESPLALHVSAAGHTQIIPLDPAILGTYALRIDGKLYGHIILDPETGAFTVTTEPNLGNASLHFMLSAQDAEGDITNSSAFSLNLTAPNPPNLSQLGGGSGEWFSEASLPQGAGYQGGDGLVKPIVLPDKYVIDIADWSRDPETGRYQLQGGSGYLSCDGKGRNLTYTLTGPADHSSGDGEVAEDIFAVVGLLDPLGNRAELPARICIRDDQPVVSISGPVAVESGKDYTGYWNADFGADGEREGGGLALLVSVDSTDPIEWNIRDGDTAQLTGPGNRPLGSFTLNGSEFLFVPTPNLDARLVFSLRATDNDGDIVTSEPLSVAVAPPPGPELAKLATRGGAALDEAYLQNGSDPGGGPSPWKFPSRPAIVWLRRAGTPSREACLNGPTGRTANWSMTA